jgi:hypothetical protein
MVNGNLRRGSVAGFLAQKLTPPNQVAPDPPPAGLGPSVRLDNVGILTHGTD